MKTQDYTLPLDDVRWLRLCERNLTFADICEYLTTLSDDEVDALGETQAVLHLLSAA